MTLIAATPAQRKLSDSYITVARWRGDRAAAISYTFDDGTIDHLTIVAPMFDRYGLKATFFINPGRTDRASAATQPADPYRSEYFNWHQCRAIAHAGHEIGCHGMEHQRLAALDDRQLVREIVTAKKRIEEELHRPCLSFAYPFNERPDAAQKLVEQNYPFATGGERVRFGGAHFTAKRANKAVERTIEGGGWMIAMAHGIGSGFDPLPSGTILADHLDYVRQHLDKLWIETFADVSRYQRERDAAQVLVTDTQDGAIRVEVNCRSLDPTIFDEPLTLRIQSPNAGSVSATLERDGSVVKVAPATDGNALIDVTPGEAGAVLLRFTR